MATDGPSWADQWGAGGIGAMDAEDGSKNKDNSNKKADSKGTLTKVKSAASAGAHKIKLKTSNSIKWIKDHCQKKDAPK